MVIKSQKKLCASAFAERNIYGMIQQGERKKKQPPTTTHFQSCLLHDLIIIHHPPQKASERILTHFSLSVVHQQISYGEGLVLSSSNRLGVFVCLFSLVVFVSSKLIQKDGVCYTTRLLAYFCCHNRCLGFPLCSFFFLSFPCYSWKVICLEKSIILLKKTDSFAKLLHCHVHPG